VTEAPTAAEPAPVITGVAPFGEGAIMQQYGND